MDASPQLTDVQRRKLLLWKRLVVWCMAGAGLFALVEVALFLWPGATRAMKMTFGGILIEFAASAAILGATGRCPACGARFGMEHQGLTPVRCRSCGVGLA